MLLCPSCSPATPAMSQQPDAAACPGTTSSPPTASQHGTAATPQLLIFILNWIRPGGSSPPASSQGLVPSLSHKNKTPWRGTCLAEQLCPLSIAPLQAECLVLQHFAGQYWRGNAESRCSTSGFSSTFYVLFLIWHCPAAAISCCPVLSGFGQAAFHMPGCYNTSKWGFTVSFHR